MKECTSCGVIKPLTGFNGNGAGRTKHRCRVCIGDEQRVRDRVKRGECLSPIATQPTAEAWRVFMGWQKAVAA